MNEKPGKSRIWNQAAKDIRIFAESIVDTIREPLVILDGDLNVVIANPAFYRKFLVNRSETEGRRIYDLGSGQWNIPGLRNLLETINSENEVIEDYEVEHDFPILGRRIMHLNARRIEQEGGRHFILLAIEDATDAVESRRAVEESEALYTRLVEEINSIIIEVSPDGAISFFNRFAEKVFGCSRNELIGKKLVGTILPETDSEGVDNSGLVAGMFQNPDQHYLNENVGIRRDGQEVWFSWSARLVRKPLAENDTILIDGNDLTYVRQVRKQARLTLEMVQASGIPMVLLDPRKTCLIANAAFAELAGKSIEEIENTKLMETGLPDDLIYRLNEAIDNAIQTGEKYTLETDYGRTTLLIRVEPESEKTGEIGGASIAFYDITERKRAEEALKDSERFLQILLDSLPLPVFYKDVEGRYKGFNKAFETFFGRPASELIGCSVFDINPAELARIYHAKDLELFEKISTQSYESQVKNAYGHLRDVVFHKATLTNTSGVITGLVGAIMDITERKEAEQKVGERTDLAETRASQLQSLAVELIEAEEHERQRIAELLHDDLQQMLASARFQLQGAVINLKNDPILSSVNEILEKSIDKSRRLSHELSPPVLYHGSLYSALEWLGRQMNEQFGLTIELKDEKSPNLENTPLKVFLFRAVQELLFNIVKHSGVKNARVTLSGSHGNVAVFVADQGKGFSKDIIDSSPEKPGFGLISIRERADRIGGHLKIESEPGQGSSFLLVLPVKTTHAEVPVQAGELTDAAVPKSISVVKRLRVLFADDHKIMRQGLIRLISGQTDIEVAGEAANGREAVELAQQLRPDVIVMDISMPVMDGIEATRLIRSEFSEVRIVGLSMFEDEQSVKNIIHAGADAFVPKTASPAELLEALYGNQE